MVNPIDNTDADAISSSTNPSTVSDIESRYNYLLAPIRDLASNWHIDIATELEEYLAELESITINFTDNNNNTLSSQRVNFTEAALLIQGSACIYSRKVEYLYSLLYQSLNVIIDNKRKTANTNPNQSAVAAAIDNDDNADISILLDNNNIDSDSGPLLSLDSELIESTNIDLIEAIDNTDIDELTNYSEYRKQRMKSMITRMPINQHLLSNNNNTGNNKSNNNNNYRLNSCLIHSNGALLLEAKDQNLIDKNLNRINNNNNHSNNNNNTNISIDELFGSPRSVMRNNNNSNTPAAAATATATVINSLRFDEDFEDNGDAADAGADWPQDMGVVDNRKGVRFADDSHLCEYKEYTVDSINASTNSNSNNNKAAADPFEILDPFDSNQNIKLQPYKQGKTYRIPTINNNNNIPVFTNNNLHSLFNNSGINPQEELIIQFITNNNSTNSSTTAIKLPYYSEFSSIYLQRIELSKYNLRQNRKLLKQKNKKFKSANNTDSNNNNNNDSIDSAIIDNNNTDYYDFSSAAIDDNMDDPSQSSEWDKANTTNTDSNNNNNNNNASTESYSIIQSYDDLCRNHLSDYFRSTELYIHSSELTARVSEWENRLQPILTNQELLESIQAFDIHYYSKQFIQTLINNQTQESSILLTEELLIEKPLIVPFQQAIQSYLEQQHQNQQLQQQQQQQQIQNNSIDSSNNSSSTILPVSSDSSEVCRLFLAALQLANNGNIDIINNNATNSDSLLSIGGIDSLQIQLLRAENYQPNMEQNQSESELSQSSQSQSIDSNNTNANTVPVFTNKSKSNRNNNNNKRTALKNRTNLQLQPSDPVSSIESESTVDKSTINTNSNITTDSENLAPISTRRSNRRTIVV